jgi:hypothetical protein
MDMRFGKWTIRSLYRAGSLKAVASKLVKYKSDLVTALDVSWAEEDSQPADDYTFFLRNRLFCTSGN